ncbi:Golgi-associated plant pathogenesis-related protein 1-like [Centruroides sculpturatus]|uniref:Golgi-associated plant pathogenesis-related protein 1-like n=1 Tax=Centruroides sculpturatus TaxID=218467 RepID=UPI000C6E913C|nr:Golgi-associated plant pathogenesis-related protein 1-like [Centruroides sculpturatus]XP_023221217.1 Golgi-associated plant pathogenesis-related protein 1-like [Centruroides sculpturatus]XP_023221218.1 Golgi-associated plant pathogenesis-related protein 1-like [Centruroides sculpturatus]XP_023221219.1 Golgi-associated plant pathogenesis-related protein 1-like [Centruroides sculpturatus]
MAEKRVIVTRTVERVSSDQPMGQRRIVKTVTTKTSGGGGDLTQDLLSKFGDFDISEKKTSHVRTFHYVTKEGTVTKTVSSSDSVDVPVTQMVTRSPQSSPVKTVQTKSSPVRVQKTEPVSNTSSVESSGDFAQDCLQWHNHYRTIHGVPPLKLSKELCRYAEEWAKNIAASENFRHRPNNKYGENIYMEWSSNPNSQVSGQKAVDSWYSEIKFHQFGREPTSLKSGHFTQVIWKESKELGVAYSRSKSGKIFVVANYNPAGNMLGSFKNNVPAPAN